jgi:hypothetical protein
MYCYAHAAVGGGVRHVSYGSIFWQLAFYFKDYMCSCGAQVGLNALVSFDGLGRSQASCHLQQDDQRCVCVCGN